MPGFCIPNSLINAPCSIASFILIALDITPSYVSNMELGKNNFTVDKLLKLTEILGVSADWLLRSNVPESKVLIDQDIAEVLSDCTADERTALLHILVSSKASIRDYSAKTETNK